MKLCINFNLLATEKTTQVVTTEKFSTISLSVPSLPTLPTNSSLPTFCLDKKHLQRVAVNLNVKIGILSFDVFSENPDNVIMTVDNNHRDFNIFADLQSSTSKTKLYDMDEIIERASREQKKYVKSVKVRGSKI